VKTPQSRGRRSEAAAAERFGAKLQPGSGNGSAKNDFVTDAVSVEWKSTSALQYPLRRYEIEAAARNALIDDKTMLFGIEYTTGFSGRQPLRVVVMLEDDYLAMRDRLAHVDEFGFDSP
jgi:hypothetical protein